MNLEEMYTVLFGASGRQGASFDVVHRWFVACGIVDGRILNEHEFESAFERLAPNRELLSLTQFIQFIDILARETRQDVDSFLVRFRTVQKDIVDEIQAQYRRDDRRGDRPDS